MSRAYDTARVPASASRIFATESPEDGAEVYDIDPLVELEDAGAGRIKIKVVIELPGTPESARCEVTVKAVDLRDAVLEASGVEVE